MYKLLAVLFLTFSLSAASSENPSEAKEESSLMDDLFNTLLTVPGCDTFPECDEDDSSEQAQMELLEDLEKQAPPSEDKK
ncbi:hypothetical protein FLL45_14250 [Aliikangiella marina]|uniref:Uncharacterized protein n=1 Tax=Aliikangiella marina TaxID=1712262 RepID=A0A545T9Y5_9GAMM|nr:hypothetical protein [Aliikangiella marina]TQV74017.1 hypothetical protein FLL45_14250 [Aliikangiella marina]